jgi:predicted nucleic acid-binding protein
MRTARVDDACTALDRILAAPTLHVLMPGARFPALFAAALRNGNATGNLAFDAQIVAVCLESGVRALLTEDRDFGRFTGFTTERL